jgi:hypothetical protein
MRVSEPCRLVLLRHGQSEWNAAGIFTGWENAHLTAHGELEAARAGSLLAEHGALPPSRTRPCSGGPSGRLTSRWRPRTATGSRCAGPGGSTGGTTERCKAGIPLVYDLGPDMRPDALGGQYLDPHAARDAIEGIRRIT